MKWRRSAMKRHLKDKEFEVEHHLKDKERRGHHLKDKEFKVAAQSEEEVRRERSAATAVAHAEESRISVSGEATCGRLFLATWIRGPHC